MTVGVPVQDVDDLKEIAGVFTEPPTQLEAHPFDGAVLAQVVGIVSTGTVSVLVAWIKSRTEKRKHMSISVGGIEASGYTLEELAPVLALLTPNEPVDEV